MYMHIHVYVMFVHTLWVYILYMCIYVSVFFTEIPRVVLMTHVDSCCPLVEEDLSKIYSSKKIKKVVSFLFVCMCVSVYVFTST